MNRREHDQELLRLYEQDGQSMPASALQVAAWAVARKLWTPPPIDPVRQCAEELSRAWREEYRTDRKGRRHRSKHAVRETRDGVQISIWADITTATHSHMERAFAQRREMIVSDCVQLQTDVDSYGDMHPERAQIEMILDFTQDVAEHNLGAASRKAA